MKKTTPNFNKVSKRQKEGKRRTMIDQGQELGSQGRSLVRKES